jgi:hypothetical protein
MMQLKSALRYLWAYSAANDYTVAWHDRLLRRRQEQGFDIDNFCVTPLSMERKWLSFPELDRRWRAGDRQLMQMYEALVQRLANRDVLILYNGANLHPEFVKWLNVLKVYTAGDDPENTEVLSKPLAPAFDIHLVNNIACVDMYRSWGLNRVYFWPLGSLTTEEDVADLDETKLLDIGSRELPIVIFCEGRSQDRRERLDKLVQAFPDAYCAGEGWPRGFVDWPEMWSTYRKAQIGWNLHNSSGPINFRTYELAAYGVMQICDNKCYLPNIYELGKEVVGFDSVHECVELTKYYLTHSMEQREIALAAWKRWRRNYTPDQVWYRLVSIVEENWRSLVEGAVTKNTPGIESSLRRHVRRSVGRRCLWQLRKVSRQVRKRLNGRFAGT